MGRSDPDARRWRIGPGSWWNRPRRVMESSGAPATPRDVLPVNEAFRESASLVGESERTTARIAASKVPEHAMFVDEPLPHTASGEVFERQSRNELTGQP